MKKLLIVAPAFPPHPSPATHRARFLVRYAPQDGWEVQVLTVRPDLYAEEPDWELAKLVPEGTSITRVGAMPLGLTRRLGIGDLGLRSYWSLRRAVREICTSEPPDLIFLPGGPFYPFLIGPWARREFGVPYVLDFTDPWASPPMPGQGRAWKKGYWASRLASALEPIAVRDAAHVLAVSDATNDAIRARHPEIPADRFSAVPFGFEASDYEALRARPHAKRFWEADGNRHLVYVGAMLPNGYETLRALLRAVAEMRREEPELGERLRLHFFGTTYDPRATEGLVTPVARELGVGDIVTEHPRRIPYVDALQVLIAADGILALGSTDHHYTASKIFPCILARRPLLAVYHEASTVCDIVRATNAGALVTYDDEHRAESRVPELRAALRALLAPDGYDATQLRAAALEAYSARATTRHILQTFDAIVGGSASAAVEGDPSAVARVAVGHG